MHRAEDADAVLVRKQSGLATVYEAANAEGATHVADEFAAQMGASKEIKPADGIPGLPSAKCFERLKGALPDTTAASWRRIAWHYKCMASADHYAFTAFSNDKADANQQISAPYRILAGSRHDIGWGGRSARDARCWPGRAWPAWWPARPASAARPSKHHNQSVRRMRW